MEIINKIFKLKFAPLALNVWRMGKEENNSVNTFGAMIAIGITQFARTLPELGTFAYGLANENPLLMLITIPSLVISLSDLIVAEIFVVGNSLKG
jgi:hypothetical protein